MRSLSAAFLFVILAACCKPVQDETFHAVGLLGRHTMVAVGENDSLRIPTFSYFIFTWHDSVFNAAVDTQGKATCYYVPLDEKQKSRFENVLASMTDKENLFPLKGSKGSCAPDLIYLDRSVKKTELKKLSSYSIHPLMRENPNLVSLPDGKPAIFESIRFEMEARYQRHYFSDDYYYKDFRVRRYATVEEVDQK